MTLQRRTLLTSALLAAGCALALPAAAETPVLDIYLVRHGQTPWNLEKRLQGATDNVLNETGRRQAAELAQRLAGYRSATSTAVACAVRRRRQPPLLARHR